MLTTLYIRILSLRYSPFKPAADVGSRRPRPARSAGLVLAASCDNMLGEGGVVIIENGELPRRLNGKDGCPVPGVRSRAPVKGTFMGADLGMTSGRSGSRPLLEEGELDVVNVHSQD